jgi:hypothetical protein
MSRPNPDPILRARKDAEKTLGRWAWCWLGLGAVASLLLPALRGYNVYVGWLPFWLLAAPAVLLGLTHRDRLAAALSAFLVGRQRRRSLVRDGQARRAARPRRRLPALRAAA